MKKLLNWWMNNSLAISVSLAIITLLGGTYVYYTFYPLNFLQSVYHSLSLFAIDVKQPAELGLADKPKAGLWQWIYLPAFAGFLVTATTIFGFASKIFESWAAKMRVDAIKNSEHVLIVGLSEESRIFIDSEPVYKKEDILIVEQDRDSHYYEKECGVFNGTLKELSINFEKLEFVLITTGNDRVNIEMLLELIQEFTSQETQQKQFKNIDIYIHLQNIDYKILFSHEEFNQINSSNLEIKPFSIYDLSARTLFEKHSILGNYTYLAHTSDGYSIILIGDGLLAERIVYNIYLLTALPNNNPLTIHCVSGAPQKFIERLSANLNNLSLVDNIQLKSVKLSMDQPDCFKNDIWRVSNLTNVIVCYDDEDKNLECTVKLQNHLVLRDISETEPKILTAIFRDVPLYDRKYDKKDNFDYFYAFGNTKELLDRKHLIEEENENIAKLIHMGYGDIYQPEILYDLTDKKKKEKIEIKWLDRSKFSDKDSNRSQALHIDTKLMAMGLKRIKYPMDDDLFQSQKQLLQINREIMKPILDDLSINRKQIEKFSQELPKLYEGKNFDTALIDEYFKILIDDKSLAANLMRSEHKRWMTFHYLEGWRYAQKKNKTAKEHNCLVSLDDFGDPERKATILYDLYSILYIPNYLANTGYRIVPMKSISLGITGHRNINITDEILRGILLSEMKKVFSRYGDIQLISPLAEGADRLFVDAAIKADSHKVKQLIVPMPFEKPDYKSDFIPNKSTLVFEQYLNAFVNQQYQSYKTHYFSLSKGKKRSQKTAEEQKRYDNEQYKKTGHYVVDNSDRLFVVWDGEPSNGMGGTAEIFNYAKLNGKCIIHINTVTYEVQHINTRIDDEV